VKYYLIILFFLTSCRIINIHKVTCSNINFEKIENCELVKLSKSSYIKNKKGTINDKNCFYSIVSLISKKTNLTPNAYKFDNEIYIYTTDSSFYSDFHKWEKILCN
jgi:hypothetical protein